MRRLLLLAGVACLALPAAGSGAPTAHVKVFFLQGEQLAGAPRAVAADAKAQGAIRALLAGPTARERSAGYRTAVVPGTKLLRVSLVADRAVVSLQTPRGTKPDAALITAEAAQVGLTFKALRLDVTLFVNGRSVATPHSAAPPEPPPPSPPELFPSAPAPTDVPLVQAQLNAVRFLPKVGMTGTWDYRTEQSVYALQAWNGLDRDGVVGPQTLGTLAQAVIPAARENIPGRHIEVYRSLGVVLLVQNGAVLRAIHSATGKPGFETPAGTFTVSRKERFSWSVPYKVWLPYASYFHEGVAFHAYSEIPATPASHGCVRIPHPEAATVYAFAKVGTAVYVY
jgi:peptidoglycan hydrolase-like protein with peptidoglycan-binding domain